MLKIIFHTKQLIKHILAISYFTFRRNSRVSLPLHLYLHETPNLRSFKQNVDRLVRALEMSGYDKEEIREGLTFSFDDGIKSNFEAMEYLCKRDIRSIAFICLGSLREPNRVRKNLKRKAGKSIIEFLSMHEIVKLYNMGVVIAYHTMYHDSVLEWEIQDWERDYDLFINVMSSINVVPTKVWAWPFGNAKHINQTLLNEVNKRGFTSYSALRREKHNSMADLSRLSTSREHVHDHWPWYLWFYFIK